MRSLSCRSLRPQIRLVAFGEVRKEQVELDDPAGTSKS
jgi:hypothetical protein